MARRLTRERLYDGLGLVGGLLERSVAKINNFLRVTQSKGRQSASLAAVIRRGAGVTTLNYVG